MEHLKVSVSSYIKDQVKSRAEELGISNAEYFRILADLDLSVQRYQSLVTYVNMLYNKIDEIQLKLGVYSAPIQAIPTVKLETVENVLTSS